MSATTTADPRPGTRVGTRRSPESRSPHALRAVVLMVFLVLATAVQLLRTPGVPAWNSLVAEDGGIFYTDAVNRPLLSTLGRAYEGYLHVVPRLLAAIASLFPVRDAAPVITGLAALVVALLAAFVWAAASEILPSRWGRGLLVLLILLLPAAGWEVNASINNLHWYLDFAVLWVFLPRPPTRTVLVAGIVVAAGAALSDPLAGLALPLAAYRFWQTVRVRPVARAELIAPLVFTVGLALQVLYGVSEKAPSAFVERNWRDIPGTYGFRVVGTLLVGDRFLKGLFARHGLAFAYLCLLVGVVAAAAAIAFVRSRRRELVVLLGYSVVCLAVPLIIRGTSIYLDRGNVTLNGSRYMLVPALTLAAALLIGLFNERDPADRRSARRSVLAVLVTMLVLGVVSGSFRMTSVRSGGPGWSTGLAAAQQRCIDRGGDVPGSRGSAENQWATVVGPGQVVVPTAPGQPSISAWNVIIDCSRIAPGVTAKH